MRKLGQHFLKNERIVKRIIDAIEVSLNDRVIEIGPGHGELTFPLLKTCTAAGASLSVIEKDGRLAADLAEKLEGVADVTPGDALEAIGEILSRPENRTVKLTGNLPYYITGHLLRIISEASRRPERCVFMVQREVAERICARPPRMNRLAASVQFWSDPEIVTAVPRGDFSPPPKVESAVISLKRKKTGAGDMEERYYRAIRTIFSQPRKTLGNNIAAELKRGGVSKEASTAKISLLGDGILPTQRPQDLSVEQISRIAEALF